MAEGNSALTGAQRAAIFLLGLGEAGAASVLRHMEPKEVQLVGKAMASLGNVSNEQINEVVHSFTTQVNEVSPFGIGATDFTRRVMIQALGEDRGRSMLNRVVQGGETKGMEALKWLDPRAVANIIGQEHPQIIALVLASLEPDNAAQVLSLLPDELRTDVILRIARLEMVDPAALQVLDEVLEKQLGQTQQLSPSKLDGLNTAASILNQLESDAEARLMDAMKQVDAELSEKVHDMMFVFDNLMLLDDRGMQRLIRDIAVDNLVIALKGVDDRLKDKFFKNMSSRAADMLREDIEAKGPVKLADVENAQKEILTIAMRLSDEGEIFLGKGGGDFV